MTTTREYLEADGLGGFASATHGGMRQRRYHGVLLASTRPPTERFLLVAGLDVEWRHGRERAALSTHEFEPGVLHPDGVRRMEAFTDDPWPQWTFRLPDGTTLTQELFVVRGAPLTFVRFRGANRGRLIVRPLLAGRDLHTLHHENSTIDLGAEPAPGGVRHTLYAGVPPIRIAANGTYRHAPDWYRQFRLRMEIERGFDGVEDLATPGEWTFDLARGPAVLAFGAEIASTPLPDLSDVTTAFRDCAAAEHVRRTAIDDPLARAATAYVVRRDEGATIVAGYPWFTDWGRDTFIAMRGLCLTTGRIDDARAILLRWASAVDDGLLPNRYPDKGERPDDNAVDASLWFVVAVHDLLAATKLPAGERARLVAAVTAIVSGYERGTRHGIGMDTTDALLRAGVEGLQLTWMDAKIGTHVVTPRIGKPVEVQALWINALRIAAELAGPGAMRTRWTSLADRATASFRNRFTGGVDGGLVDVVDDDGVLGAVDRSVRGNQVLAVGGLPFALVDGDVARRVVDVVERRLWTPLGLRSLDPADPRYVGRYDGDPGTRDRAYHMGTAWGWQLGPFVDAWRKVHGDTASARATARERFLAPLLAHAATHGGHLPEIADGDLPQSPRGCPFQAWSVGEALRIQAWLREPSG